MRNTSKLLFQLILFICLSSILGVYSCASIQHPTGGPKDSVAPVILNENPKNFTTQFKGDKISIEFDEFFKLVNETKEISVSPAMEKAPVFKVKKKTLEISFLEKLQDSTTYTINFGKSIADFNEGNVLKNYMYVLATGDKIDSLSISGTVINTLTKEPILDATVFLLPVEQDTIFGKRRASLFTTTDSSGNYSLKYLRKNDYKIYALKEENGDKIYNSTKELIGFLKDTIALRKDTVGINLEIFNEEPKIFRVNDRKIEKDGRITYIFNKKLEKPAIQILEPAELNTDKLVEFTPTNDTAFVWTSSIEFDSISVAIKDGSENLDTLLIRRSKRETYNRMLTISDNISSGRLKPGADVVLTSSMPIKSIDGKKISLLQDSIPVTGLRISRDSLSTRVLHLKYPWKEERQYILNIEENGLGGTFGGENKSYNKSFTRDTEENYGILTLIVNVPDTSKNYVLQILDPKDVIVTSKVLRKNTTFNFSLLPIGKYYIRIIYDENENNKWDTGNVLEQIQPEQVWNDPREITLRANFEIEQTITIPKDE